MDTDGDEPNTADPPSSASNPNKLNDPDKEVTVEEAIHQRLANFFEKRRASGDSRPCGPHDMAPIYFSVFGIRKEEMQDRRFLSRVKRSGLKDAQSHVLKPAKRNGEIDCKAKKKG